ncbi:MAG: diadenylate cyclase CdaA [Bacilli bacterium]|nr:diadenylate cyclase CdaA [Bacilli bacterium]
MFEEFIQKIADYTNNYSVLGIVKLVVDAVLSLLILFFIVKLFKAKTHNKWLYLVMIGIIIAVLAIYILQMSLLLTIVKFLAFWSLGVLLIIYSTEVRRFFENNFHNARTSAPSVTEAEKKELISTLIRSVTWLSKRKVGALITIERDDSLTGLIEKSIQINGVITEELLTTIFTVGTPTHDGAVIIRNNRIMCAAAYLPVTDKYDLPKSLGSRHRAAIGMSEKYDALTIVVSEETGGISYTIDGNINQGVSIEKLADALERYIPVK